MCLNQDPPLFMCKFTSSMKNFPPTKLTLKIIHSLPYTPLMQIYLKILWYEIKSFHITTTIKPFSIR